ncbi:MAG: hypothetical protein AAFX56_06520 [Pseudomonadota bacterium]
MNTQPVPAVVYDDDWADTYARSAEAGIEPESVDGMAQRFAAELRPQSVQETLSLLTGAGFADVFKPFSSLLYGSWYAHLTQGEQTP